MKKEIELNKRKVEYTLKVSNKARRLRLAIYCDGNFVVTAPRFISSSLIENFIISKASWVLDKIDLFKNQEKPVLVKDANKTFTENKDKAEKIVLEKLEAFNQLYKFKWNKIQIRNQKTRWGSCSKKGNLNFNYKIALIPEHCADYIIVHELCHLGEFNHSSKFWNLVAKAIPNYVDIRGELNKVTLYH